MNDWLTHNEQLFFLARLVIINIDWINSIVIVWIVADLFFSFFFLLRLFRWMFNIIIQIFYADTYFIAFVSRFRVKHCSLQSTALKIIIKLFLWNHLPWNIIKLHFWTNKMYKYSYAYILVDYIIVYNLIV